MREFSYQLSPASGDYKITKLTENSKGLQVYRQVGVIEGEELLHFINLRNEYNTKFEKGEMDEIVYGFHSENINNRIQERLQREYEKIRQEKEIEEIMLNN